MRERGMFLLCCLMAVGGVSLSQAAERHVMQPRVPADKLADARADEPVAGFP